MARSYNIKRLSLIVSVFWLIAIPAHATNRAVEGAIKSRTDLSDFYRLMVKTGVADELYPDAAYTIFAPDNAALAAVLHGRDSCLASTLCKEVMANIIRNHILFGKINIADVASHQGGLFSVNDHFIPIGKPNRDTYTMQGKPIHYTETFGDVLLYTVNGVIATPQKLEVLDSVPHMHVTHTKKTIHYPSCGPEGCPDASTETIVIHNHIDSHPDHQ